MCDFLYVCVGGDRECVVVCVSVCVWCFGASACSWRCGDGVQVLHQALEVGHLLGQLVGLVALGERNRVTAGGGGGEGGEGGKHLEGGKEESRGKERRGEDQSGIFHRGQGGVWQRGRMGEVSWRGGGLGGSMKLKGRKRTKTERGSRQKHDVEEKNQEKPTPTYGQQPIKAERRFNGKKLKIIPVMGLFVCLFC